MVWIAGAGSLLLLVGTVAGLWDLYRYRNRVKTSLLVGWTVFILVVPVVGLISYVLWRISRSETMEESMIDTAAILSSHLDHQIRDDGVVVAPGDDEARARDDLEILIEPRELPFDAAGHLADMLTAGS